MLNLCKPRQPKPKPMDNKIVRFFEDIPVGALYSMQHLNPPVNNKILLKYDHQSWLLNEGGRVVDAARCLSSAGGSYLIHQTDVDVYQTDVVQAETLIADRNAMRERRRQQRRLIKC